MIQTRYIIELRQGEKVEMLFTPRLYMFKGYKGVDFMSESKSLSDMYALYADVLYCGALNLWTLKGNHVEDAQFTRDEFHDYSMQNPKDFGKAVNVAIKALTGKSLEEHAEASIEKAKKESEDVKKKNPSGWITRLLRRSS